MQLPLAVLPFGNALDHGMRVVYLCLLFFVLTTMSLMSHLEPDDGSSIDDDGTESICDGEGSTGGPGGSRSIHRSSRLAGKPPPSILEILYGRNISAPLGASHEELFQFSLRLLQSFIKPQSLPLLLPPCQVNARQKGRTVYAPLLLLLLTWVTLARANVTSG